MINRTSIAHQVVKVQMEELAAVSVGEPEFLDLKQPWLYAHAELGSPGLGS